MKNLTQLEKALEHVEGRIEEHLKDMAQTRSGVIRSAASFSDMVVAQGHLKEMIKKVKPKVTRKVTTVKKVVVKKEVTTK